MKIEAQIIDKIDNYLKNIKIDIINLNYELKEFKNDNSNWRNINSIINNYKQEFIYDRDMLEIFCRSLRDKIQNG